MVKQADSSFFLIESHVAFDSHHPEYHTHFQRIRTEEGRVIPVPLGPSIPRRDRSHLYERYCRLMLIFFKPWYSATDLRTKGETWSAAFKIFFNNNPRWQQHLDNMQILHECRDSRDNHFEHRR
ncbi:uncharacterized protein EV420DRAFT_1273617, partial [Desarmillaria tabescens]